MTRVERRGPRSASGVEPAKLQLPHHLREVFPNKRWALALFQCLTARLGNAPRWVSFSKDQVQEGGSVEKDMRPGSLAR